MRALCLSGGKDSVACLFLFEHELADIHVLWVNTGKYLPEHLAWMEKLRAMCPNWHEIKTDREAQNAREGLPADIVPLRCHPLGAQFTGEPNVRVQAYFQCCWENIGNPLFQKAKELGCTAIINGQRVGEGHKAPRKSGDVIDGIRFIHPVENWTESRVRAYVESKIDVPDFFRLKHSSFDCFDCTAYLSDSEDRAAYLKARHPEEHKILVHRLRVLTAAMDQDLKPMRRIVHGE